MYISCDYLHIHTDTYTNIHIHSHIITIYIHIYTYIATEICEWEVLHLETLQEDIVRLEEVLCSRFGHCQKLPPFPAVLPGKNIRDSAVEAGRSFNHSYIYMYIKDDLYIYYQKGISVYVQYDGVMRRSLHMILLVRNGWRSE